MARKKQGPAVELPEAPEGFAWVLASRLDKDTGEWYFAASDGADEAFKVPGKFYYPIPVSTDAATMAADGFSTGFVADDDETITLDGIVGMVARYVYGKLEAGRGELRKMAKDGVVVTPELVQEQLELAAVYNTGRKKVKEIAVEDLEAAVKAGDVEAMKRLLLSKGIKVGKQS